MRIATFNVLSGRTPGRDEVDEEAFRHAIDSLDADVLALQEVDRRQPRSGRLDLTVVAARAMGAVDHRFVPALVGAPPTWRRATGEEDDDGPAYGIALLSRLPVARWEVASLPPARMRWPLRFEPGGPMTWVRDEPRVAVRAEVQAPGGPIHVVATHLSFLPLSSGRQLRLLARSLGGDRTVLAGDLNMAPRRAERITGLRPLVSGATFPAHRPVAQLDHLLGTAGIRSRGGGPVRLAVSDHRALVVEV
ncbi:MAG: endonuclease/exonuclease/phosphatase family protein [Marmoricola sp.]